MFERKDAAALRELAGRCRRLVRGINDDAAQRALLGLAEEYEREAAAAEPARVQEASPA